MMMHWLLIFPYVFFMMADMNTRPLGAWPSEHFLLLSIAYSNLMVCELWINLVTLWLIHFSPALLSHSFICGLFVFSFSRKAH